MGRQDGSQGTDILGRSHSRRRLLAVAGGALAALPVLQACGGAAPQGAGPAETKPAGGGSGAQPTSAAGQTGTPAAGTVKIKDKLVVLQEKDYNPHHNDNLNAEVTKFAQQMNWPLDLSYTEAVTGGANFHEKLSAAVASGDSPDLMFGAKDAFLLWSLKALQPVDDTVAWATKEFGDPIPGLKLADNFEGKWWAVPFFTRTGGWWARKSWFDPIGFDVNAEHDFQEWLDASLKVSDAGKQRWGWGNTVNRCGDGQTNVTTVVRQAGMRFTDTSGKKVTFNSPETIAGYEWLKDVYTNKKWEPALPPGVNAWTDPSNNQAWLAGTIGFTQNAGTLFAQSTTDTPDIGKDSFLVPQPRGPVGKKEVLTGAGGASFYVFAGAKNPEAAKQTIQHLLGKETQKQVWTTSPGYAAPGYKWGWDEPEVAGSPNNVDKVFQKIVYGDNFQDWMPGPGPRLWINAIGDTVVATEVMASILNGTPVKDAVEDGQKKIQALYDKYEGK